MKPKVLIHAAGLTDVAYCEKNPSLAHAVNAKIAGVVAEACEQTGTKMVHISTDHLSDGTLHRATETDKVGPLNVYGESKLCGEKAVLENNSQPKSSAPASLVGEPLPCLIQRLHLLEPIIE